MSAQTQVVQVESTKGGSSTGNRGRGGSLGDFGSLIPSQGSAITFCIILAILLKAEEFGTMMDALKISFELARPLLPPLVLAVCGYLLLDFTAT